MKADIDTLLRLVVTITLLGSSLAGSADSSGGDASSSASGLHAVSFISLRNQTGEAAPEEWFGDERDTLTTGTCLLSHQPGRFAESLGDNGLFYIPKDDIRLEAVEPAGVEAFWQDFSSGLYGRHPILYIHGYNTGFAKSCEQASHFQRNLSLGGRLVLFSWPSDGAFLNYSRDEADLYWSVASLEATLLRMIEQFGPGKVDVIGHSLGARGLFVTLVQLAHGSEHQRPLFNQLVFTAPDIDAAVFKQYLASIRPLARKITLYVSENDKPLALSREVHGYPRLGEAGVHLDGITDIDIIDLSDIGVRSFSGHLYHLYHDNIVHDLDLLLNHGVRADSRMGLSAEGENRWRLKVP